MLPKRFLRPPHTIEARASAREAAQAMAGHHVGCLIVVEDGRPVGIVTDRDIALQVLAERRDPDVYPVSCCMQSPVVTLRADRNLADASRTMRRTGVRRLPLVDHSGQLVGFVASDDLIGLLGNGLNALAQAVRRGLAAEAEPVQPWSVFGRE
jgi:CBS domain-containing protein